MHFDAFSQKIQPQECLHTSRIHLDLLQLNSCTIAPFLLLAILPLLCFCAFVFWHRGHMTFGCGQFQRDQLELGKNFQTTMTMSINLRYSFDLWIPAKFWPLKFVNLLCARICVCASQVRGYDILVGNKAMFVRMSCHRDWRKCHMFTFSNMEQIPIHQASRC